MRTTIVCCFVPPRTHACDDARKSQTPWSPITVQMTIECGPRLLGASCRRGRMHATAPGSSKLRGLPITIQRTNDKGQMTKESCSLGGEQGRAEGRPGVIEEQEPAAIEDQDGQ